RLEFTDGCALGGSGGIWITRGGSLVNNNAGDGSGIWSGGDAVITCLSGGEVTFGATHLIGGTAESGALMMISGGEFDITRDYYALRGTATVLTGFDSAAEWRLADNAVLALTPELSTSMTLSGTVIMAGEGRIEVGVDSALNIAGHVEVGVTITGKPGAVLRFGPGGSWGSYSGPDLTWNSTGGADGTGGWET
ncbi:MAG: hypothetical protein LBQ16_07140, partial [Gracilibacteraceae bacterium]|nr:hypothetical protein [Gracilibacteraceae bacterium]